MEPKPVGQPMDAAEFGSVWSGCPRVGHKFLLDLVQGPVAFVEEQPELETGGHAGLQPEIQILGVGNLA